MMVKLLNLVCLMELILGILCVFLLSNGNAYIFGGGFILGAVFTFLITVGISLVTVYEEHRRSKMERVDR